jgi:hypothetical protein
MSRQHQIHYRAHTVDICLRVITFWLEKLWSDVAWRSTPQEELATGGHLGCETKVYDMDVVITFMQNQILGLEVVVHDLLFMHVLKWLEYALSDFCGSVLREGVAISKLVD